MVKTLGTLVALGVLVACAEPVGLVPGGPNLKGKGGGGPPGGEPTVTAGLAIADTTGGGLANPMLGDGRDFTGAPDATLGAGGQYKDGVCNVVVTIMSHTSEPGVDPDTIAANYHSPSQAPKRPRGECVLGGTARDMTLDGVHVVSLQANWEVAEVDEPGESALGKGKISTSQCTIRLNPPVWPGSDPMLVERVANGWRVSAPQGSVGLCEATGQQVPISFEVLFVEDASAQGWGNP